MYPESNEPAKMYGTTKTHKFDRTDNIEITKLKFRPIIDQTGTYNYKAAKVISRYLKHYVTVNIQLKIHSPLLI